MKAQKWTEKSSVTAANRSGGLGRASHMLSARDIVVDVCLYPDMHTFIFECKRMQTSTHIDM